MSEPLVSIAIPTYNRAHTLRRALESALAQTHVNLEVVVSDDGSSDETEALSRELCANDARIRYLRSEVNRGLAANHNLLFAELRGEYAMLLSDDDWLEPTYVERCLAILRERGDHVLVCGSARYVRDDEVVRDGAVLNLEQPTARARVVAYIRGVDENGLLYGLMPRTVLQRAAPMRNVLANDWLLVAAIVAQGKAVTLEDTHVLRELGGASAAFAKLTTTFGLPSWQARVPHLVIAWQLMTDVAWRAKVYRDLSTAQRIRLVLAVAPAAVRWRSLAWHLTMPTFAALGRRRATRWLWLAYQRITHAMGANRAD
jgi:glycosyltransferase involved in cell wall biosynthesis